MQASIIICAHNPRPTYLTRVLDALHAQTLPLAEWELLVIDNASTEPLAGRFDISWHPSGRHVREDELGLTPARLRGIGESKADVVIFVDDDNVLDVHYLATAVEIGQTWPILGAWGGHVEGEFEVEPAEWTKAYWGYLAIRPCTAARWSNNPDDWESRPVGAGLCIRSNIGRVYAEIVKSEPLRRKLDRTGLNLMSNGDTDLVGCVLEAGLGVGVFPQLSMRHLIPASRLTEDYLLRLIKGDACSKALLDAVRGQSLHLPRSKFRRKVRELLVLCQHGRRSMAFHRSHIDGRLEGFRMFSEMRQGVQT